MDHFDFDPNDENITAALATLDDVLMIVIQPGSSAPILIAGTKLYSQSLAQGNPELARFHPTVVQQALDTLRDAMKHMLIGDDESPVPSVPSPVSELILRKHPEFIHLIVPILERLGELDSSLTQPLKTLAVAVADHNVALREARRQETFRK